MDDADATDDVPSDGASSRSAWTIVVVLAGAFVAFAYAVSGRGSPESREPARPSPSDPTTITTDPKPADVPTTVPPEKPASTVIDQTAVAKLDHALVLKLRQDAKAFCASASTTPRQGLAKYATAEDFIWKAIEGAKKSGNKADEEAYTTIYKALVEESDTYAQGAITPAFIESIGWKDVLSGEMAERWSRTTNVPGFSVGVENGVLTVTPPDAGTGLQGVVGILDQPADNLRHFQLDLEFTVEGVVTMYFHVSPSPGAPDRLQTLTHDLRTGAGALVPGAKYTLVASCIGSDAIVGVAEGNDADVAGGPGGRRAVLETDPHWTKRRRGGIAFVIPAGAHLTITRMLIRELR